MTALGHAAGHEVAAGRMSADEGADALRTATLRALGAPPSVPGDAPSPPDPGYRHRRTHPGRARRTDEHERGTPTSHLGPPPAPVRLGCAPVPAPLVPHGFVHLP